MTLKSLTIVNIGMHARDSQVFPEDLDLFVILPITHVVPLRLSLLQPNLNPQKSNEIHLKCANCREYDVSQPTFKTIWPKTGYGKPLSWFSRLPEREKWLGGEVRLVLSAIDGNCLMIKTWWFGDRPRTSVICTVAPNSRYSIANEERQISHWVHKIADEMLSPNRSKI